MKQPFLILFLVVSVGFNLFFTYETVGGSSYFFAKATEIGTAKKIIEEYHKTATDPTELIWYTDKEIKGYLADFYDNWVANSTLPSNMTWVVGFYPMNRLVGTAKGSKHDFYVIPCIWDSVNKKVLDFRDPVVLKDYYSTNPLFNTKGCTGCIAYDSGQLWP